MGWIRGADAVRLREGERETRARRGKFAGGTHLLVEGLVDSVLDGGVDMNGLGGGGAGGAGGGGGGHDDLGGGWRGKVDGRRALEE